MSNFKLVTYHINNTGAKGSKYLQFQLFLHSLFFSLIAFIINQLASHPAAPFVLLMSLIGMIFLTIIFFSFKKQAEKISIESDYIKLHYSNVWGKIHKRKIFYKGLKYNYEKDQKINIFNSRSLKIYPNKERKISFDSGYGGWKRNELQEIARTLVARGVYNRYKFDKDKRKLGLD